MMAAHRWSRVLALSMGAAALLAAALLAAGCSQPAKPVVQTETTGFRYTPGPVEPLIALEQVKQNWAQAEKLLEPRRVPVRGIYLTSATAANPAKLNALLDLLDRTELNALVINVKDDWGNITFHWEHELPLQAGAIHPDLGDLRVFTEKLRRRGVYSVARVVTFKDAYIPTERPDWAVSSTGGGIWRDYNGVPWLNPYNKAAWEYLVDVARAAAVGGFDEIQFDYVRFPTDGNLDAIVYPGKDGRKREQVIADFLSYARKELRPYGVWVSADVFGLVTSTQDDMGIGQRLEELADAVDYLSPMVYPSHYSNGNLGIANPNASPYQTVHRSMLDARQRLEAAGKREAVIMRPWLQDFSWGHPYGEHEVRAQIQATKDAGYDEWLLWNAANGYTEAALATESQQ